MSRNTKKWNKEHPEYARNRVKEGKVKLEKYLMGHPCVDCGNSDIRVLEFDHVKGNKRFDIGKAVNSKYGWETVLEEIEKCEVVCANCHKIRTNERCNSWRSTKLSGNLGVVGPGYSEVKKLEKITFNEWLDLQSEETFTEGPQGKPSNRLNLWKDENEEQGLK